MSSSVDPRWLPDPSFRYVYRFFDGVAWTADVSDGESPLRDFGFDPGSLHIPRLEPDFN